MWFLLHFKISCFSTRVQLDGQEPTSLTITADVVDCSLQLLSAKNGEQMDCLQFGCTYYGTDKTQPAILYNNSPDVINFVTVLNEEAEGMEAVSFCEFHFCLILSLILQSCGGWIRACGTHTFAEDDKKVPLLQIESSLIETKN